MKNKIINILVFASIISVLMMFTTSNLGVKFESRHGLPLLYKLRNLAVPPTAPDNVFVLTPYRYRKFGTPRKLRKLDRKKHAEIIDQLSDLGVALIVIDIDFTDPHPGRRRCPNKGNQKRW